MKQRALLHLPARHWRALSLLALLALTLMSLLPMPAPSVTADNDKLLHVFAWGAAIVPAALALGRGVLPVAGVFLGWGAAIELMQPLTGRFFEVADMLANALGLTLGSLVGMALRRTLA